MSEEESLVFSVHSSEDHIETELLMHHTSMVEKVIERETLNRQIEEFLANGGRISAIDPNVMADPPKKPENRYGSHPI
ncbi:hypothetical protein AB835_05185 [Candidatus Endobugula sertula]|uniref:Transcriptional regulator SutA RNAP-binding domain-containing protein n=1 Tax=Candidatus Endobugula sertula TaxID=62101 RepID=A0A1D2QRB7_9GAMM|nr:hypothetical protein AB835_05185 [Candidatus Endobugula sertula]